MKIKMHKHLDRKIWDKNEKLNPKVHDMLLSIAWAYIDYVRNEYDMPIQNSDVCDILIFGSTLQFFYDKQSDIDVCVVLNFDNTEKQFPNANIDKMLKLYYYDWAMIHICKVYGRKIDLNFANVKQPELDGQYRRGPIYSLFKQQWIVKPAKLSKADIKNIEVYATSIYKQILKDYKQIKKNGFKPDEMQQFYSNLIASKKQSVEDSGNRVINPVYMAVRKFKHNGYIKKMQDIVVKKETDKFVLK